MSTSSDGTGTRPQPGEFRVARFERALPRLVLVIAPLPDEAASIVALATNEIEFATPRDVRIEPEESDLAYPVLIETDLSVPVWDAQLDEPIGRLAQKLEPLLQPQPDLTRIAAGRRGHALPGPWDSRWAWKERELDHVQRLARSCFAALSGVAEVFASFGPVGSTSGSDVKCARGVRAIVDLLGGDRPPLVLWSDDAVASEIASRLLADLWGVETDWSTVTADDLDPSQASVSRAGRALRMLALAEERLRVQPDSVWAIDSALAAIEFVDAVALEQDLGGTGGVLALLDRRVPEAVHVLLNLPDAVRDIRGRDLLDGLKLELLPLRARMDADAGERFDAWLELWEGWISLTERTPQRAPIVAKKRVAAQRVVPISPSLVMRDLVDAGALLELAPDPEAADMLVAMLALSPTASAALRAWRVAAEKHQQNRAHRELDRAAAIFEAITGSAAGEFSLWLQFFDRQSGEVAASVPLRLPQGETPTSIRIPLSARIPRANVDESLGAVVTLEPDQRLDPEILLATVAVAVVDAPEAAGDFARLLEREFEAPAVKERLLRAAQAAYGLVPGSSAERDEKLAMVVRALEGLGAPSEPEGRWPSETTRSVAADLLRRAMRGREYLASEITQRLDGRRFAGLDAQDQVAAVDAALAHSEPLVESLRDVRRLVP